MKENFYSILNTTNGTYLDQQNNFTSKIGTMRRKLEKFFCLAKKMII